ncbi:MAG: DUF2202 domain-containing protein [Bacteroidetes bacterium]|nr:DUF2202 domain-containing protein [Bacteroidota bacterium]
MKTLKSYSLLLFSYFIIVSFLTSCSDSDDSIVTTNNLTQTETEALLFMLEEEKLARDTYEFLDNQWALAQFANIKLSEQSHMDAVISLLEQNAVSYNVLPYGEFANSDLQGFYDQFITVGTQSQIQALQVGATIEDLDIVDLEDWINEIDNPTIIAVFRNLQCGSRNHLRSFTSALVNLGSEYVPQFLSQQEYDEIVAGNNEQCNF